jgi:secretion/DNA translocation related TadE-like protein
MLMVGVLTVVVMLGLVATVIAGYLVAGHRARSAADLAALSGAVASGDGGDGCPKARSVAKANGAHVVSCDHVGDALDYVVTVRVEVVVGLAVPGLPDRVAAVAHAGASSS